MVIYVCYMSLGIGVGCWRAGGEKQTCDLDIELKSHAAGQNARDDDRFKIF